MNEAIQPIDPIAFHLGPISVHWYGVIIGVGALLGLWLALRECEKRGINKDTFIDLILFAIPIAIICARIYYVSFEWDYYQQHPNEIIKIWNGGIAIHRRADRCRADSHHFYKSEKDILLENS